MSAKLSKLLTPLVCALIALVCWSFRANCAARSLAAPEVWAELDHEFHEAVDAYRAGDYAAAREGFLASMRQGYTDLAAIQRNLGNVAFREGKPLEAAGWFTAAVQGAPRDPDAWFNLEFARRQAGLPPADRGDLRDTAVRLATMLRLDEAEAVVLALLALLAVCLAWEALRGGVAAKAAAWSVSALLALALVPYATQLARRSDDPCFVIQPEGAALVSEPRESAALIGRLAPASMPDYVDEVPRWVRVRAGDGSVGWLRADSVLQLRGAAAFEH